MKKCMSIIIILFIMSFQALAGDYQLLRVYISSPAELQKLIELGIDLEGSRWKVGVFIDVQISGTDRQRLEENGFDTEVIIEDLESFYRSRLETRHGEGFGFGSMGGYYTFAEVLSILDSMRALYPHLISLQDTIGYSTLVKPIVAVKISDNLDVQESEPEVLYTGLHHAREPAGMMTVLYYMWHLLENYGTDPQATFLVDNRQMWFVPVVNPDGYVHNQQTNPGGGGMWRLNGQDNNENGIFFQSGIDGVDLNRNYGYQWGYNNLGSSPYPGSDTYRGPAPFSEPETRAMRDFCNQHQFMTALNYHTYSNLLIHPWAYSDSPTPDHNLFYNFGRDMTRFNGYLLGTPSQTVGYSVNGDSDDWMYGEQSSKPKIIAFSPEVGSDADGFWPPTSRIIPLAAENLYPNLVLSYIAGVFPRVYDKQITVFGQNGDIDPGEVVEVFPDVTNYGLMPSGLVSLQLSPDQPMVRMINDRIFFSPMQTFDSLTASTPWKFQVDYPATVGTRLAFDIDIFENGNLVNRDSLVLTIGTFQLTFSDSGNSGLTQLTSGGTGGNWGLTSGSYHSMPASFTDSPSGTYLSNADYWIRSPQIDLTTASAAGLKFWTKWDIEESWDFGVLEVSTDNGVNWSTLSGNYTKPGSGNGAQPAGRYGYDGRQSSWVQESIDLQSFCGQSLLLRFRLMTDGSVTRDGWYIDDITINTLNTNANIPPFIRSVTALNHQAYSGNPYPVNAVILDDRGIDHASLFYSSDNGNSFQESIMSGTDSLFRGEIPPLSAGSTVQYYIQARDSNEAWSCFPYEAPASILNLYIDPSDAAVLMVTPTSLDFNIPQLSSAEKTLRLYNTGTTALTYQITDTIVSNETSHQSAGPRGDQPAYFIPLIKNIISHAVLSSVYSLPLVNQQNPIVQKTAESLVITDPSGDVSLAGVDITSVDFSENTLSYDININFTAAPDTNSVAVLSFDVDQNFASGVYPAPLGYGLGNFDIGSEYEIFFDFANIIGDSVGLQPSAYVLDVRGSNPNLVGLPILIQFSGSRALISLLKFLYSVFDKTMNISAMMVQLSGISLPDMAPDYGHGNLGGELGSSWVSEIDTSGTSRYPMTGMLNPGDSTLINVKVAAAYPLGSYQSKLVIENNGTASPLEVPVSMVISLPGVPSAQIDPLAISDTLDLGSEIKTLPLTISNTGNTSLYFTIVDSVLSGQNWLSAEPSFGVVSAGELMTVQVRIDPATLTIPGLYEGQLRIITNDPLQPAITVPVAILMKNPSSITSTEPLPHTLNLYANFPNPFNPTTTISFDLPGTMDVTLEIYDLLGQKVTTLLNRHLPAGRYKVVWNGQDDGGRLVSSGLYIYRMQAGYFVQSKKMLFMK